MKQNDLILLEWAKITKQYFESHVKQRFLFLNYFILISGSIATSHIYFNNNKLSTILFIFYIFVIFIFMRLENRVKFFIKQSTTNLREIESRLKLEKKIKLFNNTKKKSDLYKEDSYCKLFSSYGGCFFLLYFSVIIFSTLVFIFTLCSK